MNLACTPLHTELLYSARLEGGAVEAGTVVEEFSSGRSVPLIPCLLGCKANKDPTIIIKNKDPKTESKDTVNKWSH